MLSFLVLLAACGRLGFDAGDTGGGGGDGPANDPPRLITTNGPGASDMVDVTLADDGSLAVTGSFDMTLQLAGASVPSLASMKDIYVAALARDGTRAWLWSGGCTTICNTQGVRWLGTSAVAGGYLGGTLTNGGGDSGSGQDALVTWLGPTGQVQLASHYGGVSNVQIRGLDANATAVAITGLYADTVDFGTGALPNTGGNDNGFVAVFDVATRTARYAHPWNGPGDVYGNDIAIGSDGSVCIAGRYMVATNFGGGTMTPANADGFVARTVDPNDRRNVRAALTSSGRAAYERASELLSEHEQELDERLGSGPRAELARGLRALREG